MNAASNVVNFVLVVILCAAFWVLFGFVAKVVKFLFCAGYGC